MTAPNVAPVASTVEGFFEESPNVRSMTRLNAFMLSCGCLVMALSVPVVALKQPEHAPAIIGAVAAAIGTLGGSVWGALRERN